MVIIRKNTNTVRGLRSSGRGSALCCTTLSSTLDVKGTVLSTKNRKPRTMVTIIGCFRGGPLFGTNGKTAYADTNAFRLSTSVVRNGSLATKTITKLGAIGGPVGTTCTMGAGAPRIVLTNRNTSQFTGSRKLRVISGVCFTAPGALG